MSGQPWGKFYWSDWASDPKLKLCSLAAQGLWMRMLCIAAEANPVGYVAVNGHPLSDSDIIAMVGGEPDMVGGLLAELAKWGVFSRDRRGCIYSRRMVSDEIKASKARDNGKLGGNPSLGKQRPISASDNPKDKPLTRALKPDTRVQKERGREGAPAREPEPTLPTNLDEAVPSDLGDMQNLAAECARAAGTRQADPVQFGRDVNLCREWTAAGADPELILATIREGVVAATEPIHSLKWFSPRIRTVLAKQKALENGTVPRSPDAGTDPVTAAALARMAARRAPGADGALGLSG